MIKRKNNNISPDGKWQISINNGKVDWIDLTKVQGQYTIKEIVESMKSVFGEWKEKAFF